MKISCIKGLVAVFTLALVPSITAAQYEIMPTSQLLLELQANIDGAREVEPAVKANLAERDANARELQVINRENTSYLNAKRDYDRDLTAHNNEVDRFNAECLSGTFDQAGLDRCESMEEELSEAQEALDERRNELEDTRVALNQRKDEYNNKERQRAQAAEQVLSRYDEYNANIETILAQLEGRDMFRNSGCTNRPSPEAALQCFRTVMQSRQ